MKILIISGIPIRSDTNCGKTLQTLFADFARDELCQLYFSPSTPNTDACCSYYQICEKQMLRSFFGLFRRKCGGPVEATLCGTAASKAETNALAFTKNKRTIFMRYARETVWALTHWENRSLRKWLHEQSPDVIFAVMNDTNSATSAIKWVAKETNCPVVYYITDDYYNDPENSRNFLRKLYFKRRHYLNKCLVPHMKALVGCSKRATDYFADTLNFHGITATAYTPSAPAFLSMPEKNQAEDTIVKIRYFGNLGLGRWQLLKALGTAIKEMNRDGQKALLEVYSSDHDPSTSEELTIENGCVFRGWISGQDYLDCLQSADVAVHVESFNQKNVQRTWCSISTKIADYLGAAKCILAIGPSELASIDHIKNAACTITDVSDLKTTLGSLIADALYRAELQQKARKLAERVHDINTITRQVRSLLTDVAGK